MEQTYYIIRLGLQVSCSRTDVFRLRVISPSTQEKLYTKRERRTSGDMIFNKETILDKEKTNLIYMFLQNRLAVKTVEYIEARQ